MNVGDLAQLVHAWEAVAAVRAKRQTVSRDRETASEQQRNDVRSGDGAGHRPRMTEELIPRLTELCNATDRDHAKGHLRELPSRLQ